MEYRYGKSELRKPLFIAALLLLLLVILMVGRGGGYGIGGLTWDNHLTVTRSSLRLDGMTVLPGDHIRYIYLDGRRKVHRDADLRGALRALGSDQVFIELARPNWEIAVPLTPEAIARGDLPAVLRGPFQVTAVDGRRISGVLDIRGMAEWMAMNGDQPALFTVSVPEEPIVGMAHRVKRPGPVLPVVILILALGAVVLAHIRARSEVMSRVRRRWNLLGLTLALGGVLLAFLTWHDGFLADPALIPLALVALMVWRPLSLFVHQSRGWQPLGSPAPFARLGMAIPPAVLLLASFYGWIRTIPGLWGARLDGFVLDQLRDLILLGALLTVLYHLVDIGLYAAQLKRLQKEEALRLAPSWLGTLVSSLFLVTAVVSLAVHSTQFFDGGWVPHLAGLVAVQWLGDMVALPIRTEVSPLAIFMGPRPDLVTQLEEAARMLELADPQYAIRFHGGSVSLRLPTPMDHASLSTDGAFKLIPEELDEKVSGLLELLDAEGGMFPRYKTIKGGDEVRENPFDGLERSVGVELALPLQPPGAKQEVNDLRVHLISRRPEGSDKVLLPPSSEALESWQRQFFSHPEIWPELRAAAAQGALTLMARTAATSQQADTALAIGKTPEGIPVMGPRQTPDGIGVATPRKTPEGIPVMGTRKTPEGIPVMGLRKTPDGTRVMGARKTPEQIEVSSAHGGSKPALTTSTSQQETQRLKQAALLHDRQTLLSSLYPIGEPDLVSEEQIKLLQAHQDEQILVIRGEYGSGREFSARLLHRLTDNSAECVAMDCSLIPQALVLAELAGEADCPGRLALAENGTMIIRNLSLLEPDLAGQVLQAALRGPERLVLLDRSESRPKGKAPLRPLPVPKDAGLIELPPLRERPDDIERAARYYLHQWAMSLGRVTTGFSPDALEWLKHQEWPTNYHSLISCLRDTVARGTGATIDRTDLSESRTVPAVGEDFESRLEEVERSALMEALEKAQGNKSQAARLLGMKRTTFIRKLARYHIED
ncbi:MAG: sigma 54-interacting transcriptional regulator [Bradymonadales bacterium]|nr:sigma 54-interacting transcriptional regulator [Bradymonadales bacterium]